MSRPPPTRRDYERTIKAILQSRKEVQKIRDAVRSDEHFSGALVSGSVPIAGTVSVARETNHTLPPVRLESHVYTIETDEQKNCGTGSIRRG